MEGNEMSVAFENQTFNRRTGLGGGRMGCTLVTGFLGSGKTTLLRHLLDHRADLRLAVLVNEFAASDVDSLLLDSARVNSAFNLSTVSLTHGCACCDVRGPFRESLQRIVDSKHNFDCLLVETSGLARPDKFVEDLEEVGINLDVTVAVVDAESLDKIIKLDIVKKQLEHVDLVLLNKCDLATLGQVSDAEDILERVTGGARVVRSQFCKVPLELVIDCSKIEDLNTTKEECSAPPVLSHEALPKMAFRVDMPKNPSVNIYSGEVKNQFSVDIDRGTSESLQFGMSQDVSFSSVIFESEAPLSLALFQSRILRIISRTSGLLRAKGLICFSEDRGSRFVFQWSGLKRIEAVSGRPWDGAPKSCLVFIGHDNSELENIVAQMSRLVDTLVRSPADNHILKEYTRSFSEKVAADGRFKVPSLDKEPVVIFGLKGSPLRGIKESQLSGALMRVVNGKGNIFLTATTSAEEYNLQLLFDEGSDPDNAWNEIRLAASAVISMLCKNFCPCRSNIWSFHLTGATNSKIFLESIKSASQMVCLTLLNDKLNRCPAIFAQDKTTYKSIFLLGSLTNYRELIKERSLWRSINFSSGSPPPFVLSTICTKVLALLRNGSRFPSKTLKLDRIVGLRISDLVSCHRHIFGVVRITMSRVLRLKRVEDRNLLLMSIDANKMLLILLPMTTSWRQLLAEQLPVNKSL